MSKRERRRTLAKQADLANRVHRWPVVIGTLIVIGLGLAVFISTFEFAPRETTRQSPSLRWRRTPATGLFQSVATGEVAA